MDKKEILVVGEGEDLFRSMRKLLAGDQYEFIPIAQSEIDDMIEKQRIDLVIIDSEIMTSFEIEFPLQIMSSYGMVPILILDRTRLVTSCLMTKEELRGKIESFICRRG